MLPLSLYIHIPWCIQKCPYCDFNSHAIKSSTSEDGYITALLSDLSSDLQRYGLNRPLNSIFIGGGTPSLFKPESIDRLLNGVKNQIAFVNGIEITLEANPGTFESKKFAEFRHLGINRLSIGIQSFNDASLKRLGRVHSAHEAHLAAEIADSAGFENFNLDLMFGLPDANIVDAKNDIQAAIRLNPSHISFYQLTLEPNTYFHKFPPQLPDDETIFTAQILCQKILAEHGYQQYEVSAYSQPGKECKHNLNYWQFGDYIGIGAGAHGKISQAIPDRIIRSFKFKSPEQYLKSKKGFGNSNIISQADLPLEFMMNHLRLKHGFSEETYQSRTGLTVNTLQPGLSDTIKQGLLVNQNCHYSCSEQGWQFLDTILQKFVA
ncbi:MAG: radical SAM family heme chaperone HemW [Methylococcaceae bacterium]|nr:radical SAM family heme chaperone HemW [Methylococcaceae bacterium]